MSYLLNALVLAMNGGPGSGWPNPDHAAYYAAKRSKIAPDLNGEGSSLVYGIINNWAVEEAIINTGVKTTTTSPTTTQLYKDIVEEKSLTKDLYCMMKRQTGSGMQDVTSYRADDKAAMIAADRVVQTQKDLASQLTRYANAVPGDEWVGTSKVEINKKIKQVNKLISETKRFRVGLVDVDGKFTKLSDALNNTQKQLQIYYNSVASSFEN